LLLNKTSFAKENKRSPKKTSETCFQGEKKLRFFKPFALQSKVLVAMLLKLDKTSKACFI
jgi:hypothetical protein